MPMGPLVVLSPSFVAPFETTFLLQERVSSHLLLSSRTTWLCLLETGQH